MHMAGKIQDAFERIEASEELKASTKAFLHGARQRQGAFERGRFGRPGFGTVLGSVCLALVLLLGAGGYALLGIPVSYVSIDVNPSIELALNRLDRVICASAYNPDGEEVLGMVSVKGMRYIDAIDAVVESDAMQPFLSEDAGLTFTVAAGSGQKAEVLRAGIERSAGCLEHGGASFGADIGILEEAHENGLSVGKYAAYQILIQYGEAVTVQDCHEMTMAEIHGLIECHEHSGTDEGAMEGAGHDGQGAHTHKDGRGHGHGRQ